MSRSSKRFSAFRRPTCRATKDEAVAEDEAVDDTKAMVWMELQMETLEEMTLERLVAKEAEAAVEDVDSTFS